MNALDLSRYDLRQLYQLQQDLVVEVEKRKEVEKNDLLFEIRERAALRGLKLEEVLPSLARESFKKTKKNRAQTGPVYRNPDDPNQIWRGRGRQSAWVKAYIQNGGNLDDLKVE